MMQGIRLKRCLTYLVTALVCGSLACAVIEDFFASLGPPAGQTLLLAEGVQLRMENASGLPATVEAVYRKDQFLVRRTTRQLAESGLESAETVAWTLADTITVTARVADTLAPGSSHLQPGDALGQQEFLLNVDFQAGDTIVFVVPIVDPPSPPFVLDCNVNGVSDLIDVAEGTSEDCNANGVPDECDLADGTSPDCQPNGIPDECESAGGDCNGNGILDACDIADGTSADCQPNGIPDECESAGGDCNGNGILDECDIADGTSADCQPNGVPDECDLVPVPAPLPAPVPLGDPSNLLFPLDATYTLAMAQNDDDSSAEIALGFSFYLYGALHESAYINNNGNLSFGEPYGVYSSTGFPVAGFPMIAPFWADVDTGGGDGNVWYKIEGQTLIVTWDNVGYYSQNGDKLNTFQVALSDGLDPVLGIGNNVCFSYDDLEWTTGDASGGSGGFGGTPSTVGVNEGNEVDFFLIGRFDHEGTDYDGPEGENDGVSFLDGQTFCFSTDTTTTNISPIPTGFPQGYTVTLAANLGETLHLPLQFPSPEPGQTTTVSIADLDGAEAAGLVVVNTPGNVAGVDLDWSPGCAAAGTYLLEFTATDDFDPPGVSTTTLTIIIECHSSDCNENGVPDECDIADGTSDDVNQSGVPDECELQACCYDFDSCSDLFPEDCLAQEGQPQGVGTLCQAGPCATTQLTD